MIGIGRCFLQSGVRVNHLAWDQVLAHAEVLQRALGLGTPQFIGSDIYFTHAVGFLANIWHIFVPANGLTWVAIR